MPKHPRNQEPKASFHLCNICGKHGYIRTAKGFRGNEFFSKSMAIFIIQHGVEWEVLGKWEAHRLTKEINRSPLPKSDSDVSAEALKAVNNWNLSQVQFPGEAVQLDKTECVLEFAREMEQQAKEALKDIPTGAHVKIIIVPGAKGISGPFKPQSGPRNN